MNRLLQHFQGLPDGWRDWPFAAVLLSLVIFGAGCGEEVPMGGPRVGVVPITCKVLVDDKPQEDIIVSFLRVSERGVDFPFPDPRGVSDKDGNFIITSYLTGDGGAPGEYKLIFEWGQINPMTGELGGDKFRGKYANMKASEYSVTVPEEVGEEPFDIGTIELSSK